MGAITKAVAICNNEVAFVSWDVDGMIPGCLGFDIVRIYIETGERRGLATYVPFKGQKNKKWQPQDTSVWPVQKTGWRDLTLRKRRDKAELRPDNVRVKYEIRPVGRLAPGLEALQPRQAKTYDGDPVPLGYMGAAVQSNEILVTSDHGDVHAAFNNGILSGQWLRHAIEDQQKEFTASVLLAEIQDINSPIRQYLAGDVTSFLKRLIKRGAAQGGRVHLALYELDDEELVDLLIANKASIEIILSNSSAAKGTHLWDGRNQPARQKLVAAGVSVQNRMFNNSHIGHNKFAVYVDAQDIPRAVMTGSTNWTTLGLCGQSNNAIIFEHQDVAAAYLRYWQRLHEDVIDDPEPQTAPGKRNVQGQDLREADQHSEPVELQTGKATFWYSPNTLALTRSVKKAPPDLEELFALMADAKEAIFFLAFLPSRGGLYSIIETARQAGETNADLLVVGAISDPTAMPNYVAKGKDDAEDDDETPEDKAAREPAVYDERHTHIVRATRLGPGDAIGDFEEEILRIGNAIVHDKIVVIDPLSENCVVATGSHNLGYKASYENDENLVIIRGNQALAKAYVTHVYDVCDHYRYRAWQAKNKAEGKPQFDGHIDINDQWMARYVHGPKSDISNYFVKGID